MYKPESRVRARESVGVVHCVDVVNRELTVLVHDEFVTFDVPVDCDIVLHGERIRFRMVQPLDRVRITHARWGGFPMACRIDVQPDRNP